MFAMRQAGETDFNAIWQVLEPIIRAGETYALARGMTREEALAYWFGESHRVFVAEENANLLGTYFLCANRAGGGAHVANCGYATAIEATGKGVGTAMCVHSMEQAKAAGFRAMQFNFVVSTNAGAVRLWERLGFEIAGRMREAFLHPSLGYVDAFLMYRMI